MEKQKHLVATASNGGALYPGRSVLVTDISREYPIPDDILQLCEPCDRPAPSNAFLVNARAYAQSQQLPAPPPPDRQLTQEQLWKARPWTRDAAKFALATAQYDFPRPLSFNATSNLLSCETSYYVWSASAVDLWHVTMRAKAKEIEQFIG